MPPLRWLAVLALCACGDNLFGDGGPLVPADDLVIVAHQDDDLIFMQPDVLDAVKRGGGLTSVYVTAGNGTSGTSSEERYAGLRAAYAEAAGSSDWQCGWIVVLGHYAQHCRLADRPVSLVFLGYPDGGKEGERGDSLLHLWDGAVTRVETVGQHTTIYDRNELVETVAQIIRATQPRHVHTLEVAATHGRDHSDHMVVGALALLAMARANSLADVLAYRGYKIADEPPNKLPAVYDAAFAVLARYEACTTDCGECGDTCTAIDQTHVTWLLRRYAVGFRNAAAGRLRIDTRCLATDLTLADCATAPSWRFDAYGELRSADGRCLFVDASGNITLDACLGGPARRVFLDDEGHIWSGVPPTPAANMDYAHLWCLTPTDTGARMQLCGLDGAPSWDVMPRTVATPRSDLGFSATGRDVRLGDLTGDRHADLCTIDGGLGLLCAPGDGAGSFAAAVRVDSITNPLAIDPKSLTLGDVDGDDRLDACGRDAEGILCATAASNFSAARWSPSFNDDVARSGTSQSITAIDANDDGVADICGLDLSGVVCAPHGLTLQPLIRSAWPQPTSVLWPADLDGDRQADWCSATDDGPMCAVEAERNITTDGAPWGYALDGVVEVAPATTVTVSFADIDGDHRADQCSTREDRIVCARSQGRAFGPRTTLAILPNQAVASALWLGDIDGDGRADACADTGTTIVCAVEP